MEKIIPQKKFSQHLTVIDAFIVTFFQKLFIQNQKKILMKFKETSIKIL